MRAILRSLIVKILSSISRKMLKKHKPFIIAITGNIGKTSSKDCIYNMLSQKYGSLVRGAQKTENSEFGVNLTILGEKNAWNNPFGWIKIIIKSIFKYWFVSSYPEILVLEVGADKPGDIKYITSIFSPDVVVLTAFQKSPTHGEFFLNEEQHILEKKSLLDGIKRNGTVVYNMDDEIMSRIASEAAMEHENIKLISYGTNELSNVQISGSEYMYDEVSIITGMVVSCRIKFEEMDFVFSTKFPSVLGASHTYCLASAIGVALLNDFSQEEVIKFSNNVFGGEMISKSRMRLLKGINNSIILDDTYNSSPKAAENFIEAGSKVVCKGKKIIVLGHMAELGKNTKFEHFNIGLLATRVADYIILSGRYNAHFLEGIRFGKFDLDRVYMMEDAGQVIKLLKKLDLVKENDLIMLKGSQSARLEKVVVSLLQSKKDKNLVCRQDAEWEKR
jgi:UDP-N-acetylmuramoyl-tripeptide--D-alanyl-D-alanine ligase